MKRKKTIHDLLKRISTEILEFIKEEESSFKDRWVPSAHIKNSLELNFIAVPKTGTQYGPKGWLFAILARMLEDENLIKHKKVGSKAYYRSV